MGIIFKNGVMYGGFTEDFDATPTENSANGVTSGGVYEALADKVDKVTGKDLSSNDFTDALKEKLDNLDANAEANVNADWESSSGDSQILNKPTLGTASSKDVAASGDASSTEVVMGNDSRLTDSRNAADVYSWAKAETKPTYTASEVGAISTTLKGASNGVAELDSTGKVPSSQLPSYVDDVIDYPTLADFPSTGESGKIYVDASTNTAYRWSGSTYVSITSGLSLGETSSDAYRGDRGKIAYDHSQTTSGNPHNVSKSDIGLGNVENKSAATIIGEMTSTNITNALGYTPANATDLGNKVDKIAGKGLSTNDFTDALKTKLDGLATNAEENVQSDWSETDSTDDAYIKNKPTTLGGFGITDAYTKSEVDTALAGKANSSTVYTKTETDTLLAGKVDKVQGKGLSTEDFTTAEKNKLSGIEAGAEVNVNADWNADSGDAQILNKPQIYTKSEMDTALGNKADVSALTAHTSDKNNPHEVTAAQVPYGTSTVASALAEMAGDIADVQNVINLLYDTDFILNADNYKPMMQLWFMLRNADDMTPAELTALCDEWYTVTRRAWHGWVVFPSSGNSYATRYGDLVGVVVEPSTRETEARDDLKGNPLFATMDCNWTIDSTTKEPVITAIDGVTSGFVRDDPAVYVGVLQMSGYFYQSFDQSGDETNGYSSTYLEGYGMVPVKESIRPDGTVRPWVVHGKYMSGQRIENSTEYMTCCSGQKVKAYNKSHNALHTMAPRSGTGFSGGTVVDWTWMEIMHRIVYACMASDPINAGCLSYNYTAYAQVAETDVKRILCTPSAVTSIEVGSCVLVGAVSSDNISDKAAAACYSISGQLGAIVTGKENVEVGGVTYTAVYVDTDSAFTTAANGNGVAGTTLIMTFHWPTGALDNVKGHNGSIAANTSGKRPALLQGIEYMVGAYDVFADIIVKWIVRDGANVAEFYVVNDATDQASDVTADYVKVGELVPGSGTNAWLYLSKMIYQNGVFTYASVTGGSSSTFERDQVYCYRDGTTTGLREWLAFCSLASGVAVGGLSASGLTDGLGLAHWNIAARLSPNGTRGELTA